MNNSSNIHHNNAADQMSKDCELLLKSLSSSSTGSKSGVKDINIRKQNARNRWKLLARAILSDAKREEIVIARKLSATSISSVINNVAAQEFDGFDLVKIEQINEKNFTIKIDVAASQFECNVHIEKLWTIKDLIGFNNTGNITFWSSEAALCYFVMENLKLFDDSWVLELGGGMFNLCGLMLAKYSNAFAVHLTDGNYSSLQNVKKSVMLNELNCFMKCSGIYKSHSLVTVEKENNNKKK
jgi:hypothetical protein